MSFRTSGIVLATLVVALLAGCAALVPGYTEEHNALLAQKAEADEKLAAANDALAAATKAGDPALVAAALEKLSAALSAKIDAISAVAKHEVESAGKAGAVGVSEIVTGGAGLLGLVLAALAKAQSAKNTVTVAEVKSGPSRAQPEIDDLWEQIAAVKAEFARMQGPTAGLAINKPSAQV